MKSEARVLIIDDDSDLRSSLALYLKIHFQAVKEIGDPRKMHAVLNEDDYDIVLLDMNFQTGRNDGQEGLYWLKHLKEIRPEIMVLLITAYADIDLAIEALKSGASDFILKPWENQKLLAAVLRAYELKSTRSKLRQFKSQQDKSGEKLLHLIESTSVDPSSIALLQEARTVAKTEANVLLLGENGTGKSLMAQYIHFNSPRKNEPFVHVDLGAIPESLFESELFGHKKGAFTDAHTDRDGLVAQAEGGTLFLDEIANCSLQQQQKLLRLLQDRSYQVLGSNETRHCDIRIISATNVELEKAVEANDFRQDLFYRLNTLQLQCRPLRSRRDDIPQLSDHYLSHFNRKYQRRLKLKKSDLEDLKTYPWPGNIRELSHSIERAVILSHEGKLSTSLVAKQDRKPVQEDVDSLGLTIEQLEAHHIKRVLVLYEGNISKTAKHLGVNRNTLYRKLEKYQINDI